MLSEPATTSRRRSRRRVPHRGGDDPAPRGERGGVTFAVLVLLVVTMTGAAALAAGMRSLTSSGAQSGNERARAAADVVLAESVARIVGGADADFDLAAVVDSAAVSATATRTGADAWAVEIEVDDGSIVRRYAAEIDRSAPRPVTIFAISSLRVTDNDGVVEGLVASNGRIEIVGSSPGEAQILFGPDGTCSGCERPVSRPGPRPVPPTDPPEEPTRACPDDGLFTGTIDGRGGTAFVCDDPDLPVVFSDTVEIVRPPLVVHVAPDVAVDLRGSTIAAPTPGDGLRLIVDGPGDLDAEGAAVTGTIVAPARTMRVSTMTLDGTLVVDELVVTSGGTFAARPDPDAAADATGPWRIGPLVRID